MPDSLYRPQLADAADAAIWLGQLQRDGYCIIRRAADPTIVAALSADLDERFARTPFCVGGFYGARTKRFGALLKRSAHAAKLVSDPLILEIAQGVLGPYCDRFQLNLTQAIEITPGQAAQPPHRDQDMWLGAPGSCEYLLNVMWPFTPYTKENGATILWPGSHKKRDLLLPQEDAIIAEMEPGDALLYLGSTLHGGGAGQAQISRRGAVVSYCLGWLKPYENQWLVYPPEIARSFPPELAALVGYQIHRPNLGNVEGRCPSLLLEGDLPDYVGAVDELSPAQAALLAAYHSAMANGEAFQATEIPR